MNMDFLTACELGLLTLVFAAFTWALFRHFLPSGQAMPRLMKLLSATNVMCLAVVVASSILHPNMLGARSIAIAALIFSLTLFCAAVLATRHDRLHVAFAGAKSSSILRHGPYRYVRHPFYASYIVFWIAGALGTASPLGWTASALMITAYCIIAIQEERQLLSGRGKAEYSDYMRTTGRFFPKLSRPR